MKTLFLHLLLFVSATCFSQKHNNVWHFGNHAGLNFNNGDPQPIKGKLVHYNNTASVSDLEGKLLFYSDGKSVWDRNHNVMPNGNELTGGILALQPALIIPFPASYLKFFLFTSEGISTNGGLSYSIVDMTLNDSYGDIISGYKNILVKDSTQHTVAAILHPNQIDIWIITYLRNSNEFLSYLVTSSGIEIEPVISQVNSSLLLDPFYGSIKTSHNGLRIALHTHSNTFEVFDFNPLTGSISDANNLSYSLSNPDEDVYGFEFSPNDSLLYLSTFRESISLVNHLYQLDLNTLELTDLNVPVTSNPGGLQLGPDNKIYCTRPGEAALGIIHQPDNPGLACQLEHDGAVLLPGTRCNAGLPAKVPYSFTHENYNSPTLGKDTSACDNDLLTLKLKLPSNFDSLSYTWNTGSTDPEITVNTTGKYWVEAKNACITILDTIQVDFVECTPIVYYNLDACTAYMHNGSNMDYSEFTPSYPNTLICIDTISAGVAHRISNNDNKHSCTNGVNGSTAMCISSHESCEYVADNLSELIIQFAVTPNIDSHIQITGIEFFEKSPETYSWINGNSGVNNYPLKFGIKIFKNGQEIFTAIDIETKREWNFRSFNFINDSSFLVEEYSEFRIELLPYCPVSNGADVSAWDIDEIRIFGSCNSPIKDPLVKLQGHVTTMNEHPMEDVEILLSENTSFDPLKPTLTDNYGYYEFNIPDRKYFIKGHKNNDILNGVSTADILAIQNHLLGKSKFSSLHQFIAADINHSDAVTAIDIVELRKVLLGISAEFKNNTSWRFGPADQSMDGSDIRRFNDVGIREVHNSEIQIIDFIGIKIGDVNDDAILPLQDIEIRKAESCSIAINIQPKGKFNALFHVIALEGVEKLEGMQFSLKLLDIDLISLVSPTLPISDEFYSLIDGIFRLSWNSHMTVNVNPGDTLFRIDLQYAYSRSSKEPIAMDFSLKPELYLVNREPLDILINFNANNTNDDRLPNNQFNIVNLNSEGIIHFTQKHAGITALRIFDLSGKLLFFKRKYYSQGEHRELINIQKLPSGIYICQFTHYGSTYSRTFVN